MDGRRGDHLTIRASANDLVRTYAMPLNLHGIRAEPGEPAISARLAGSLKGRYALAAARFAPASMRPLLVSRADRSVWDFSRCMTSVLWGGESGWR